MSKFNGGDIIAALSLVDRLITMIGNIGSRVRERIATGGARITEEELDEKEAEVRAAIADARDQIREAREAEGPDEGGGVG